MICINVNEKCVHLICNTTAAATNVTLNDKQTDNGEIRRHTSDNLKRNLDAFKQYFLSMLTNQTSYHSSYSKNKDALTNKKRPFKGDETNKDRLVATGGSLFNTFENQRNMRWN